METFVVLTEDEISTIVTALDNQATDQKGIYKEKILKLMTYLEHKASQMSKTKS